MASWKVPPARTRQEPWGSEGGRYSVKSSCPRTWSQSLMGVALAVLPSKKLTNGRSHQESFDRLAALSCTVDVEVQPASAAASAAASATASAARTNNWWG